MYEPFNCIFGRWFFPYVEVRTRDPQKWWRMPCAECQSSRAAAAVSLQGGLLCDQNSSAQTVSVRLLWVPVVHSVSGTDTESQTEVKMD